VAPGASSISLAAANPLWERACSRIRWVSLHQCWMCRRLREQAHSHTCSVMFINTVHNTKPCGSEPAREENDSVPAQNTPPKSPKILSPTALPYTVHQATHPCAFAYNYARIRPLVRLVPGLYCLPATAHQWSGLVARLRIRSHESHQSGIACTRWWLCAWRPRARRVSVSSPVY
jgi:hypothetical protein